MAHWTDGPEYAPTVRPDVFVEPGAAPLPVPVRPPSPDDGVSIGDGRPGYLPMDAPPLEALAAPEPPGRDPREAFDVTSTPITSWSGGGASPLGTPPPLNAAAPVGEPVPLPPPAALTQMAPAGTAPPMAAPPAPAGSPVSPMAAPPPPASAWHAVHAPQAPRPTDTPTWAPDQPFPAPQAPPPSHIPGPMPAWPPPTVNPGGFDQGPPPPWAQPVDPNAGRFRPVSISEMLQAATPAVMITLGLGVVLTPLALPLLLVASALATRVQYRRQQVRTSFNIGVGATAVLSLLSAWGSSGTIDLLSLYSAASGIAQLACLVLLVVVPLQVGEGLRRGEQPVTAWHSDSRWDNTSWDDNRPWDNNRPGPR